MPSSLISARRARPSPSPRTSAVQLRLLPGTSSSSRPWANQAVRGPPPHGCWPRALCGASGGRAAAVQPAATATRASIAAATSRMRRIIAGSGAPQAPAKRRLPSGSVVRTMSPVPPVTAAVYAALSRQLQLPLAELERRSQEGLDRLGLDSHGLMRVLLDIERALRLPTSLQLDDAALATPASLAAGVTAAAGPV
jgi:hypothetical protein